jgi:flagellar hook-associated protein 1
MSLFSSLTVASQSMNAFRTGLDVTGQNIANINTPGYSRRTLDLAEVPPTTAKGAGRGVEVLSIRAARDFFINARIGREGAGLAKDDAILSGVSTIEAAVGLPGQSIDAKLTEFFDSFSNLAIDVTSATSRDDVVNKAQDLAGTINTMSAWLTHQQRASDASIRDGVNQLNQLAARVAELNDGIVQNGADVETLRDERDLLLKQMAELADVAVISREDGAVDVTVANGRALVIGAVSYDVQVTSAPPNGFAALSLQDTDITAGVTNGRLGGLIELRDAVLPRYHAGLDQFAFDLAREVNALHVTGVDGDGNAAGSFFTPIATVSGAAAALAVDPAVAADSQLVAGSLTSASGDNQIAQQIAGLRDGNVMTGGTTTPAGAWAAFVYEVGSDVSAARAASLTRGQVMRQLEKLRDQASGVSLDEEAANLIRFQRSYEASARYFTTIVDTLDTLMGLVR